MLLPVLKMSELKARGAPDEVLMQYEFLLVKTCRLASQIQSPDVFEYFYSLYDLAVLKSDEMRYLKAKNAAFGKNYQQAKEELRLCLAINPRHFWALVLICQIHFEDGRVFNKDDTSYALSLLSQIGPNSLVHALQSKFMQGINLERHLYHAQASIALYFETCPFDLELLVYSRQE